MLDLLRTATKPLELCNKLLQSQIKELQLDLQGHPVAFALFLFSMFLAILAMNRKLSLWGF